MNAAEPVDDLYEAPSDGEQPISLSEQQNEALERVKAWYTRPGDLEFHLGGAAGTGKTTLIREIIKALKVSTEVASFTGKAVAVLRKKGMPAARTMHNLLYKFRFDGLRYHMEPVTSLYCDLVIVDEASMVSQALYDDLRKHDKKVLFVGDPFQLEPIGENPNLLHNLDYELTEIHRQARKSPILRLATAIREGLVQLPLGEWEGDGSTLSVVKHLSELEDRFDVVVCGKNATRHRVNALRRKQRNYTDLLHVGETVLCLANNSEFGVFNGMTFTVKTVHKTGLLTDVGTIYADLVDDAGQTYLDIPIRREFFGKNYKRDFDKSAIPFDYGYCLTAHKSQGSEFDNVLVIDEPLYGGDTCRWRYTAATRAAKNLTYAL